MKKLLPLILLFSFSFLASTAAQSLQNNEYYRTMVELKNQSQQAFDLGDYQESTRLAEESQSYKALSDEWIANQLLAYRARSALVRVKERLKDAAAVNAEKNFPEELAEGSALYKQAFQEFYDEEAYGPSLDTSNQALELLSVITFIPSDSVLPAFYQVRLLPGNTDCLWNIAGYDFIFNNPLMWPKIYEANKDKLVQRHNPDLIHPELTLTIPSQEGERRAGTWVNGRIIN